MPWKKRNPSTHIVEQDENGNIFPIEAIYLVKQTQPCAGYFDKTIYVYTDEDDAKDTCRKLNKEYGNKDVCKFNSKGDFIDMKHVNRYAEAHYYDVEEMLLNEEYA